MPKTGKTSFMSIKTPKSHFSFFAKRSLSNQHLLYRMPVVDLQSQQLLFSARTGLSVIQASVAHHAGLFNCYLRWFSKYLVRNWYSVTFFSSAFQRGVWSSIRLCTSRYSTSMRTATFPLQGSIPSRSHAMPSFYLFRISDVTTSYPVVGTTLRMNCTVQVSKDHYRWMILFSPAWNRKIHA